MGIVKGEVLRIEKTSIHDGDGLRTVVFLKGCPLRCKWCSTPESQQRCVTEGYGVEMTADAVVREICKDEIFYFHSGGGVTISGGEVLLQPDFAAEILRQSQEMGISTAIETSLYAEFRDIEKLLPYLSSMYVDFKVFDEDRHVFYTGVSNRKIKENLEKLDKVFPGEIFIRIPVVPTVNMNRENMVKTARFLGATSHLRHVELLPYHKLGLATYDKLHRPYELKGIDTPSSDAMHHMAQIFKDVCPDFIVKIKGEIFQA